MRRWAGRSEAEQAAQPLLAGYHKSSPRLVRLLLLALLAGACIAYGAAFGAMAPARMMPFVAPIALLLGLILWTLPPGEYAPIRLLEPLFVAFFAALVLWPNYLALSIANLPWLTMLRITGGPLMIAFLACISISKTFRTELAAILAVDKPLPRMIVGLVVLWTISIVLSSDPGFSINRYIIAQINLVGIFFVSCYLFSRPGFAELWIRQLVVMLALVCVFGLWEFRLQALPWAGHIPSFLKIDDPVVQQILTPRFNRTAGVYRVLGTSTTPLGLAELLGLAMPFAMHFVAARYSLLIRVAAAIFIPVSLLVILLTDSRLGVVAACASGLFYILIWGVLRWRRYKDSLLAPAIVLSYPAVLVAFFASTFLIGRLRVEFWGSGAQQASTQGRLDQWVYAIPKILGNPFGYGIGRAAETLGFTNRAGQTTIDSYWLSVVLEIGVVGFIVFYGLMLRGAFVAARAVIKVGDDRELGLLLPMSVALLNFVIVKMVLSQDANHPLIFMILGAVVALTYRANQLAVPEPAAESVRKATRRPLRVARPVPGLAKTRSAR